MSRARLKRRQPRVQKWARQDSKTPTLSAIMSAARLKDAHLECNYEQGKTQRHQPWLRQWGGQGRPWERLWGRCRRCWACWASVFPSWWSPWPGEPSPESACTRSFKVYLSLIISLLTNGSSHLRVYLELIEAKIRLFKYPNCVF